VEPDCLAQRELSGIAGTVNLKFAALAQVEKKLD
jgi:hypothetical protein